MLAIKNSCAPTISNIKPNDCNFESFRRHVVLVLFDAQTITVYECQTTAVLPLCSWWVEDPVGVKSSVMVSGSSCPIQVSLTARISSCSSCIVKCNSAALCYVEHAFTVPRLMSQGYREPASQDGGHLFFVLLSGVCQQLVFISKTDISRLIAIK